MKELHTFGWYAARIRPLLPEDVFKPVPSRLIGGLPFLCISIVGMVTIVQFNLHPLMSFVISFFIGCSFASLGFLGHEILHGTVVKTPWIRDLLGAIAFWPLSTGPKLWRKWHNMNHHVHTQHNEKDPDAWPALERVLKFKLLRSVYRLPFWTRAFMGFISLSIQFSLHSIKCFFVFIKEFNPRNKSEVCFQAILPWVTWIGLLFVIGIEKWLFVYLLPLLIANFIVMAYISTNHRLNPQTLVNDPLANSLTVKVPKWIDRIHFNFSYHTEHHLFPTMNPKYYPLVKEYILNMWPERYHEMPMGQALKALWNTPRVYYNDKNLIDPNRGTLYGSLGHGLNPKKVRPSSLSKQVDKGAN